MSDATFRSIQRIRKQLDFDRCHQQGRRYHSRNFVLVHLQKDAGPTRLGVVVSRATGGAVVRNRWKRIVRDFFRTQQRNLPLGSDEVVIIRKASKGKPPKEIRDELTKLFERIRPS